MIGNRNQSSQFRKRAAAVAQVAAILLLQVYSLLPMFGHFTSAVSHGAVCRGDHRLCGCPPERIVNRTCCCFKSLERTMNLIEHLKIKETIPRSEINRIARYACPPCGKEPDFVPASVQTIKFLRFAATAEGPYLPWVFNIVESGETFQTRSNEPPDPPPKSLHS